MTGREIWWAGAAAGSAPALVGLAIGVSAPPASPLRWAVAVLAVLGVVVLVRIAVAGLRASRFVPCDVTVRRAEAGSDLAGGEIVRVTAISPHTLTVGLHADTSVYDAALQQARERVAGLDPSGPSDGGL